MQPNIDQQTSFRPAELLHFFEEISAIPRASEHEAQIAHYLCEFARQRGLDVYTDEMHNVIIRKNAQNTDGAAAPVMLQGHTDMVCEKTPDSDHNFDTDSLHLIIENGVVRADRTTLGADNGVAVALMLTVLDDRTITHPPLECVFTTQEEIGLNGARELDKTLLKSRMMINLDSEEEGVATVSCAGGVRIDCTRPLHREAKNGILITITVGNLKGGHSGSDIHKERGNALILAARLARRAAKNAALSLVDFNGGNKDNAIPREATVSLLLETQNRADDIGALMEQLQSHADILCAEICDTEPDCSVSVRQDTAKDIACLSVDQTMDVLDFMYFAPNGVLKRNYTMHDFVVTSSNMGIVRTDHSHICVTFAPRSSMNSQLEHIKELFSALCERFHFAPSYRGEYMGWDYAKTSPLRSIMQESWRSLYKKDLKLESIHAGLECGLFCSQIPGLDAIAVGPSIYECHTPSEHMPLDSLERFYVFLRDVLDRLAQSSSGRTRL